MPESRHKSDSPTTVPAGSSAEVTVFGRDSETERQKRENREMADAQSIASLIKRRLSSNTPISEEDDDESPNAGQDTGRTDFDPAEVGQTGVEETSTSSFNHVLTSNTITENNIAIGFAVVGATSLLGVAAYIGATIIIAGVLASPVGPMVIAAIAVAAVLTIAAVACIGLAIKLYRDNKKERAQSSTMRRSVSEESKKLDRKISVKSTSSISEKSRLSELSQDTQKTAELEEEIQHDRKESENAEVEIHHAQSEHDDSSSEQSSISGRDQVSEVVKEVLSTQNNDGTSSPVSSVVEQTREIDSQSIASSHSQHSTHVNVVDLIQKINKSQDKVSSQVKELGECQLVGRAVNALRHSESQNEKTKNAKLIYTTLQELKKSVSEFESIPASEETYNSDILLWKKGPRSSFRQNYATNLSRFSAGLGG
jgi:hypothetical protein